MPAELLEQEAEIVETPEKISGVGAVSQVAVKTVGQPTTQKAAGKKTVWREIFEGHEDLLGWTPD